MNPSLKSFLLFMDAKYPRALRQVIVDSVAPCKTAIAESYALVRCDEIVVMVMADRGPDYTFCFAHRCKHA